MTNRQNTSDAPVIEIEFGSNRRFQREVGGQRRQRRGALNEQREERRDGRGQPGRRHVAAGGRRGQALRQEIAEQLQLAAELDY